MTLKTICNELAAGHSSFLWYYTGSSSDLSQNARLAIEKPGDHFFVSIVSLWEIAIKNSLGKLDLEAPLNIFFQDVIQKGFNLMPIDLAHIVQSATCHQRTNRLSEKPYKSSERTTLLLWQQQPKRFKSNQTNRHYNG